MRTKSKLLTLVLGGTGKTGKRVARRLAARGVPEGWISEIATTCAVNHYTWENELPPGDSIEDGLPVRLQVQLHKLIWGAERTGV